MRCSGGRLASIRRAGVGKLSATGGPDSGYSECEIECRSLAHLGICPDPAAMALNDARYRSQPDTGAFEFTMLMQSLKCAE